MSAEVPSAGRPRDPEIDTAVLEVARAHLATVGYEAMSLVAVAEEAGTTRPALYRRWPSKADLATAAIASMSLIDERVDSDSPFRDLVAELAAFRQGVTRRNGISLIGTMLQDSVDPELAALFRKRLVEPRRTRLRHILERGREDGLLAQKADIELATAAATGALYSMALSGSKIPKEWAERAASFVWRGCGGEPEGPADR